MGTIPLHLERRCQQRWAARFARQAQKETIGLNRGAAVPTRVDEKPTLGRPTLASQGIDKNLRAPRPERCERGAVVRRQECF
jgi:hypothetical protein